MRKYVHAQEDTSSCGYITTHSSPNPRQIPIKLGQSTVHEMGRLGQLVFYPTLAYNVARNYLQPAYAWYSVVDETLILGALPFKSQMTALVDVEKVGGVVCLNESFEMEHDWVAQKADWESAGVRHYWLPTPDFFYSRPWGDVAAAVAFIRGFEAEGRRVYVHCKAGRTRSATIAACYLMDRHNWSLPKALDTLRAKRYQIVLRDAHTSVCEDYYRNIVEPRFSKPDDDR